MLQAYKLSCSSTLRNHPQEQGFLNSDQRPLRQIKLTNRNQQNKHLRCFGIKVSASADGFFNNDSKSTRKLKPLGRIFSGTLEHGFILQPKDDHSKETFQSDLWRHLETFDWFTRPHTIFGSIFGITSVSLLPLSSIGDLSPAFFVGILKLPLLRWKRNGFLAVSCILIVRAITIQLATYMHIQKYVLGRPMAFTRSLGFALAFMTLFTTVISLFKDIPDVDGDRDFGINSFSVKLGKKRVFWLCISILLIAYGSAVAIGASSSILLSKLVTVLGHCTLASLVLVRAQSVNLNEKASITSFYMFIWKLFYAEYVLIPFVR